VIKKAPSTAPISCAWQDVNSTSSANIADEKLSIDANVPLSIAATIGVIAGLTIFFALSSWFLHVRTQRWRKTTQVVGISFLIAVAVAATIRIVLLSQAFGHPSVKLSDEGEKQWSFGQLVPLLMILLPIISGVEILRGKFLYDAKRIRD
jgi:hypothetical protein